MRSDRQRWIPAAATVGFFLLLLVVPAPAADPEIDRLLRSPVGKDWVTDRKSTRLNPVTVKSRMPSSA